MLPDSPSLCCFFVLLLTACCHVVAVVSGFFFHKNGLLNLHNSSYVWLRTVMTDLASGFEKWKMCTDRRRLDSGHL
jgi:hypothetical protein